jgi:hypothetical protein
MGFDFVNRRECFIGTWGNPEQLQLTEEAKFEFVPVGLFQLQ